MSDRSVYESANISSTTFRSVKKLFGIQFYQINKLSKGVECDLIFDYVLIARNMKTIIFPATLTYNYVTRKCQPCLVILVASLKVGDRIYPIDFDFWVDKYMYEDGVIYLSKNEITEKMVDYFHNQCLNYTNLIVDAGFCSPKFMNYLSEKNIKLTCKFPKNRKIIHNGVKKTNAEIFEELENRVFYYYHEHGFVKGEEVEYHGIKYQLVAVANTKDKLNAKEFYIVITNDLNVMYPKVIKNYKKRWKIECLFKILKSYLGFCSFNSNNEDAIINHINFCFSAFIVLQEFSKKYRMTIHESLMEIQSQNLDWIRHVVTPVYEKVAKIIVKPAF